MKPKGIKILGIILVVSSIIQLNGLLRTFEYYKKIFEPMPEQIFLIRFIGSVMLRIIGLVSGVGILYRKDMFRKLAILLGVFTVTTIYWKHPYDVISKFSGPFLDQLYSATANPMLMEPWLINLFTLLILVGLHIIDIMFSMALIYYFTRPYVKQEFK